VISPSAPRFSRPTFVGVVLAHAAVAVALFAWSFQLRPAEPPPLMVTLMSAPPEPDALPSPMPVASEPVVRAEPKPPVQPRPEAKVVKSEPLSQPVPETRPMEPEPAVEQPPPPVADPPKPQAQVPTPPAPAPQPQAVAAAPAEVPRAPAPPPRPLPVAEPPTQVTATTDADAAVQAWKADYLRNPKPVYPNASRRLGERGIVLLRVLVTATGEPAKVDLKKTSGYARLDESALEAVRNWKFVPARLGETPVEAWVVVPIEFSLKG
jgi:protein TonB